MGRLQSRHRQIPHSQCRDGNLSNVLTTQSKSHHYQDDGPGENIYYSMPPKCNSQLRVRGYMIMNYQTFELKHLSGFFK